MEDPFFAKVVESQKAWAKRVVYYDLFNSADYRLAYEHYFGAAVDLIARLRGRCRAGRPGPPRPCCRSSATGEGGGTLRVLHGPAQPMGRPRLRLVHRHPDAGHQLRGGRPLRLPNAPTTWSFDLGYMMYGALFFMAGAYTLARGGHVRADIFYRLCRSRAPRPSSISLLYFVFFFPGVVALVWAGTAHAEESWRYRRGEHLQPDRRAALPAQDPAADRRRRCSSCRASPRSAAASAASATASGRGG